jgi:hypothetical protein
MVIPAGDYFTVVTTGRPVTLINQAGKSATIRINHVTTFASGYRFVGHFLIAKVTYCH